MLQIGMQRDSTWMDRFKPGKNFLFYNQRKIKLRTSIIFLCYNMQRTLEVITIVVSATQLFYTGAIHAGVGIVSRPRPYGLRV